MSVLILILALLVIGFAGYVLCRARAVASVQGNVRKLHSLPTYYGWHGAIMAVLPALAVLTVIWLIAQPLVIERGSLRTISRQSSLKMTAAHPADGRCAPGRGKGWTSPWPQGAMTDERCGNADAPECGLGA
jgi:hypothetical protein